VQQSRKTKYTQTVLKDSLIELMREKSISKITIKELCERADINRTTFYAHYASQYQLLESIENETLSWVKETIVSFSGKTDQNVVRANLEKIFDYIIENRNHIQVLMSERGDIDFQRNLMTEIYAQCGMWLAGNVAGAAIGKSELYFVFIVNGSVGLIQHWLKNGLQETTTELADIIFDMTYHTHS
jgi:AcrR family transcriptional regulator